MPKRKDIRALPEPYRRLHDALAPHLPEDRILADPLRRLAFGTDASFYRLVPKLVVQARSADEVARVLREAAVLGLPVTFRAAGTSLSGQSISDSVLLVVAGGFRGLTVLDGGERVACEPGVIGADVNLALAPFGRKLGPDPASIGSCMVGGIAANNSSGMCCGTAQNTYRTVESMKLVLWDGTFVDTADGGSRARLADAPPRAPRAGSPPSATRSARTRRCTRASRRSSGSRTRRATRSTRSWTSRTPSTSCSTSSSARRAPSPSSRRSPTAP